MQRITKHALSLTAASAGLGLVALLLALGARPVVQAAGTPPEDLDRVARLQGAAVDLGAYEWQGHWRYLPLVTQSFAPRAGWAIGDDKTGTGVIVHTDDSGLTWQVQSDSSAWTGHGLADVSAVDAETAWVALENAGAGTEGGILHTTDGGATWVRQTIPAGLKGGIKGIKGLSHDEAWAASLGGTVLHTTDGGATWNVVPHPTVPITQVNRIDTMGTDVWVADAWGNVYPKGAVIHTRDGGLTWGTEHLPEDGALTVHAFSPLAVWASGTANAAFYRTVNGGEEWTRVSQVAGQDHLDDICAASADDVWGVLNGLGANGSIWRVHVAGDGTADADDVSPPELFGYTPGGVTCLDTQQAWVVAQTWVQQPAPTDIRYWKVSFVGARR